jgi:DNA-binding transcriptional LysR family regulator
MNVTFRQLKLFMALADTGSVSAAAQRMHVTQPTASMQLKDVADAVGLPLYDVISRKVHLTEAGEELARTARTMLDQWEAFEQRMAAFQGMARGRLRVAVVSTAKYFIPGLLGSFCDSHPEVDISLEVLNRDQVVTRLRANMDDLYVMSQPPDDMALQDDILMPNPLYLVAPASHPLAGQAAITLAQLASSRFVLRERGSGTRMATDRTFKQHGFAPANWLELGSNEAIRESVASKLGVAVLSSHALDSGMADARIAVLDVEGFPIQSQWHLVWLKGKQLSPLAGVFRAHVLARMQGRLMVAADTAPSDPLRDVSAVPCQPRTACLPGTS